MASIPTVTEDIVMTKDEVRQRKNLDALIVVTKSKSEFLFRHPVKARVSKWRCYKSFIVITDLHSMVRSDSALRAHFSLSGVPAWDGFDHSGEHPASGIGFL